MPLLDHFRPPLSDRRHWHAFHNAWATYLSSQLNASLPDGYFAEPNVQFGIEIDVAAFDETTGQAVGATPSWFAPPPSQSSPVSLSPGIVEVGIFSRSGGPVLAGAVELVSPANKDRPAHRESLVSKCATYVQAGVGLVLVDIVTERAGDFHFELLARLGVPVATATAPIYASAYRPVGRDGSSQLDVWYEPLRIGRSLPTMPLWLRGELCVPVDLDATYERTCAEQRVTVAAA